MRKWEGGVARIALVLVVSCGGGTEKSPQGSVGGYCYPNGTCNVGLSCVAGLCIVGEEPDSGVDAIANLCGNGVVDTAVGETCDTGIASGTGACPASCNDNQICTSDTLANPGTCMAACMYVSITAPNNGDGCCPSGANANTDDDCTPVCGNSAKETGETCDTGIASGTGSCPSTCADTDVCTTDALVNGGTCTAACTFTAITAPANGDGCCPMGATRANDSDCPFTCNDDSAYEQNNTIQTAYDSTVAGSMTSRTITGLAICPAADVDNYKVTIVTANTNLDVLVEFAPDGSALMGAILNSAGVAIANAVPVTGMPQRIRAYTPNLPTGVYYVEVHGPTGGVNNYTLTLDVTGP